MLFHKLQNPKSRPNGQCHRGVLEFASILHIVTPFAPAAGVAHRQSPGAQPLLDCCSRNTRRNARRMHQYNRLLSSCGVFSVERNDKCLVGPDFNAGQNLPLIHSRATLLRWLAQILKLHRNESYYQLSFAYFVDRTYPYVNYIKVHGTVFISMYCTSIFPLVFINIVVVVRRSLQSWPHAGYGSVPIGIIDRSGNWFHLNQLPLRPSYTYVFSHSSQKVGTVNLIANYNYIVIAKF